MYKLSGILFSIIVISLNSIFLNLTILAAEPLANADADRAAQKAKKKEREENWDVNKPPYKTHAIPIDVKSGTWMNLDVSPDGKEIIFTSRKPGELTPALMVADHDSLEA